MPSEFVGLVDEFVRHGGLEANGAGSRLQWRLTPPYFILVSLMDAAGLVVTDRGIDDLTDEEGVRAEIQRVTNLAVHPRDRLVEDRRPGGGGANGSTVQCVAVGNRGLRELDEHPCVLAVPQVHGERAAGADEAVRDGGVVDADPDQDRLHRQLRDPARRHRVALAAGSRPDECQGVGDLPGQLVDQRVVERFGGHDCSVGGADRLPPVERASLPEAVVGPLGAWLDAHDVAAPGVVEGLYVVGSIALGDWTPHSDIDIVAVVADPSDPDLFGDLESAQSLVRERVGVSIDGPYVAWGDLVVPAMAVQRPWVLDGQYRVDGESFEINPVTWYTLAAYGLAIRGDEPARIGVSHDVEERRSWVAGNLDTYWRGVGEARSPPGWSRATNPSSAGRSWSGWRSASPGCSSRSRPATSPRSPVPAVGPPSGSPSTPTSSPGRSRSAPSRHPSDATLLARAADVTLDIVTAVTGS